MNIYVFMALVMIALLIIYSIVQYAWLNQLFIHDKDLLIDLQSINMEREYRLLQVAKRSNNPEVQEVYRQMRNSIQEENRLLADFVNPL